MPSSRLFTVVVAQVVPVAAAAAVQTPSLSGFAISVHAVLGSLLSGTFEESIVVTSVRG